MPVERRLQKTRRKKQQKGAFSTFGPKYLREGAGGIYTRDERQGSRRKSGPKTEKRRKMPIRDQIMQTEGYREKEILWTKDMGGNLKQVTKIRAGERSIYVDFADIPKADFFIHNHPNSIVPTPPDIETLSNLMRAGKAKTGAIAVIGKTGKVNGYTVFKLNKPWPEKAGAQVIIKLMEYAGPYMRANGPKPPKSLTTWKFINKMRSIMEPFGIEMRMRFVPAKGFEFSNKKRRYIRKRPKKSQPS